MRTMAMSQRVAARFVASQDGWVKGTSPSSVLRGETQYGMVAKRGPYEIWADRARKGEQGRKEYYLSFSVYNRDTKKAVPVPSHMQSNVEKMKAFIDKLIDASSQS